MADKDVKGLIAAKAPCTCSTSPFQKIQKTKTRLETHFASLGLECFRPRLGLAGFKSRLGLKSHGSRYFEYCKEMVQ